MRRSSFFDRTGCRDTVHDLVIAALHGETVTSEEIESVVCGSSITLRYAAALDLVGLAEWCGAINREVHTYSVGKLQTTVLELVLTLLNFIEREAIDTDYARTRKRQNQENGRSGGRLGRQTVREKRDTMRAELSKGSLTRSAIEQYYEAHEPEWWTLTDEQRTNKIEYRLRDLKPQPANGRRRKR